MAQQVLRKAKKYCDEHRQRLTKPRMQVLKIIASSSKPLGAYDILKSLGKVIKNPKPPTVYRAIEFWKEHGFVHRIESLNAYVSCEAEHRHKGAQFMVCDDCGTVIEAHVCELPSALKDRAIQNTFTPFRWNVEIHGVCGECR